MANQTELLNVSDEMKLEDDGQNLCDEQQGVEELCSSSLDTTEELYSSSVADTCGDGMSSVKKSPINQRFLRFWKKNRCVFLFPKSDDIIGDLPQGIGFLEQGYTFWRKDTF